MSRPKLLDLFCCEGGASMGYHRAGFDVYGVDLFKHKNDKGRTVGFSQKRYPFPSLQMDALDALDWVDSNKAAPIFKTFSNGETLSGRAFDVIVASPPCQKYSITNAARKADYPDLVGPVRELLQMIGKPYVIENVEGSPLQDPLLLCGTMFGLRAIDDDGTKLEMWRHRLFESNIKIEAPFDWESTSLRGFCEHGWFSDQVAGSYGGARRDKHEARHVRHGGYVPAKHIQQRLLGIDWMTEAGMHQSIPPAYTEHIGAQLLAHIKSQKAA